MRITARIAAIAAALLVLAASGAAAADDDDQTAEARRLYGEAKKLMGAKKYQDAALAFEAAGRLKNNAVAYYTAAQAWELANEAARAADAYALALVTPKLSDAQKQKSEERLVELRKELGVVNVKGDSGTRARIDDHTLIPRPAALHGAAGSHTLVIARPGGAEGTQKVELLAGKSLDVDAAEQPEPQPDAPKVKKVRLAEAKKNPVDEPSRGPSPWKTVGFVGIGAGVAALGGGVLLGLSARDAEDTYKKQPTQATLDHAKGLETSTNIMLIAGGVLTAAGVTLVVWPSKRKEQRAATLDLRASPGAVLAGGRF